MSKGQKIFMYVLLAIVVGLLIWIGIVMKKGAGSPPPKNNPNAPNAGTGNTNINDTDASKAGVDTSKAPATIEKSTFNLGDKIYAGSNILNAYTSCDFQNNTIWSTYSTGDFIGDYLRKSGQCIVVAAPQVAFGFFPAGTKEVYLLFNASIYVKNS